VAAKNGEQHQSLGTCSDMGLSAVGLRSATLQQLFVSSAKASLTLNGAAPIGRAAAGRTDIEKGGNACLGGAAASPP